VATNTLVEILALVVAKIKTIATISNRIYHRYPPTSAAYPCISYYDIAIVYNKQDDETIPMEFVLSFDLWGTSPVYTLENELDTKLKELTIKVEKENSISIDEPMNPTIYRRNCQYRFIWNY